MEELKLGIIKSKELADWFQISASTYYNQKSKKLKELEQYCKFEDLGKKGVNILEIYNAYYQTKARQKVKQIFDELFKEGELVEWGQDDNSIDTATHFANKILKKYGDCGVKFNTLVTYVRQEKKARYGKNSTRKNVQIPGTEGSAKYVFCKLLTDGSYVDFTEEEKKIKRELYKQLNVDDNEEELEDFQAIRESYQKQEISENEYIEYCNAYRQDKWYAYVAAIEERLNCKCVFATHLTKKE